MDKIPGTAPALLIPDRTNPVIAMKINRLKDKTFSHFCSCTTGTE